MGWIILALWTTPFVVLTIAALVSPPDHYDYWGDRATLAFCPWAFWLVGTAIGYQAMVPVTP